MGMITGAKRVKRKQYAPVHIDRYLTPKEQEAVDFYEAARKREKEERKRLEQMANQKNGGGGKR